MASRDEYAIKKTLLEQGHKEGIEEGIKKGFRNGIKEEIGKGTKEGIEIKLVKL